MLRRKFTTNRRNKYRNTSCICQRKHIHQSIGEAGYCNQLDLLERAGEIKSYKSQVVYRFKVRGKHITTHIVDFVVTTKEGKIEVHEFKGFATVLWRVKMKLFEACYPKIPYIVVRG